MAAAKRRLFEELRLQARLRFAFQARYRGVISAEMTENELVYVYFGALLDEPTPDPQEIDGLRFLSLPELQHQAAHDPDKWAVWLRHYLRRHAADMALAMRQQPTSESQV